MRIARGHHHHVAEGSGNITLAEKVVAPGADRSIGFERQARLRSTPAATAITLFRPHGTLTWSQVLSPQATTVPLARKARLCHVPAPTAITFESVAADETWP